jgi:hypothetical protein
VSGLLAKRTDVVLGERANPDLLSLWWYGSQTPGVLRHHEDEGHPPQLAGWGGRRVAGGVLKGFNLHPIPIAITESAENPPHTSPTFPPTGGS